jgi:hypothetical protein
MAPKFERNYLNDAGFIEEALHLKEGRADIQYARRTQYQDRIRRIHTDPGMQYELAEQVDASLARLKPNIEQVIRTRFGLLQGDTRPRSSQEVSAILFHNHRVRAQAETSKALLTVRHQLKKRPIYGFQYPKNFDPILPEKSNLLTESIEFPNSGDVAGLVEIIDGYYGDLKPSITRYRHIYPFFPQWRVQYVENHLKIKDGPVEGYWRGDNPTIRVAEYLGPIWVWSTPLGKDEPIRWRQITEELKR